MSTKHLGRFFALNTAPEIMATRVFPNIKEITESMGAWIAVKEHLVNTGKLVLSDPNVTVYCVGDGHTPRTGTLVSFLSKWSVVSIDPVVRKVPAGVKRVAIIKSKIEDVPKQKAKKSLILAVHSHASLAVCVEKLKGEIATYVVSIPCCYPDNLGKPNIQYVDDGILSDKNTVNIYFI